MTNLAKPSLMGTVLAAALSLMTPTLGHAVQIGANAAISSGFADAQGNALPSGDLIYLGTFTIGNGQIAANASDLAYLASNFITIGASYIGQGDPTGSGELAFDNHGLFNAAFNGVNTQSYAGSQLYYWVFDANAFSATTAHGIFSSTAWVIPSGDGSGLDLTSFSTDISDLTVDPGTGTGLASSAQIVVGDFGFGVNPTGGGQNFNLVAVVPEPSTYAMLVAGAVIALGVYRRRKVAVVAR